MSSRTTQRLNAVNPAIASGATKELLNTSEQALETIPNSVKVMANSPAVLEIFLSFDTATSRARIAGKVLKQVNLTTSETNSCDYCSSLVSAIAPSASLSADEILAGRTGSSVDQRTQATLQFTEAVSENRGKVSGQQLTAARNAGFEDSEIVKIVASVVLCCVTNFLNNVAGTELDIPQAEAVEASSTCQTGACSVGSALLSLAG